MQGKLLIIGFVWPEPKSSAAGVRMLQLIAFFQNYGYEVTFVSACAKSHNAVDLSAINVDTAKIELNASTFDAFIVELNPQIVVFDRFMTEEQFGWRVSEGCPNAIKILNTEDLHFLRRARQQMVKASSNDLNDFLFSDNAKREIASIYRCDLSLIISKAELALLKDTFHVDESLLFYLPFLMETMSENHKKSLPNFEDRQHFMTIGNFLHEPNYDALLYLKETLWKSIKQQLPNAELHNYGAYVSQKVLQLHNEKEGFLIKGFAEDVDDRMQRYKVLLAPLRFGAGLKGKLFDAMKNGLPFVTTRVGAEGIFEGNNLDLVCDSPEEFIDQSIRLYQDKTLWETKQLLGFEVLSRNFPKDKLEQQFTSRLMQLSASLQMHRQQNFIGQLLQHHTLQSTKYMSKWIEAKNLKQP